MMISLRIEHVALIKFHGYYIQWELLGKNYFEVFDYYIIIYLLESEYIVDCDYIFQIY